MEDIRDILRIPNREVLSVTKVLTGLDLGSYEGLTLMDDVTGTNQSVLAHLYVGRRGIWDEKQVPTYEGCAELWDTLTAGAVSTAAE